ncbi:MAG: crossover junction endodeoxyribonuclease RuvC [Candidatus Eisenbacteria bacterium]|nr:crossover junction endodeoxyribonuclease RuvC [Candidatus Eisenbacteria bacterium]
MIVLGVDPGENVTGFCIIEEASAGPRWISGGKIEPPKDAPFPARLLATYRHVKKVVFEYEPDEVAMEGIVHAKNVRSTAGMAQVRGVIALAAAERDLSVFEYTPSEIKQSVVGNGAASKQQVQYMVERIMKTGRSLSPDEADALAVGLCHLHRSGRVGRNLGNLLRTGRSRTSFKNLRRLEESKT